MSTRFANSDNFASMLSSIAGPDYGKMGNQAQQMQGHLQRTAMTADANARKSEIEAQKIIDMAPYKAAVQQAQAGGGGGGGMGDIFGKAVGLIGGLSGGGGGGANMGGSGYYDPMTGLGTAGPNFGL